MTYEKAVRCLPSFLMRFTEKTNRSKNLGLLRWTILVYWNDNEEEFSNREMDQLLRWLDLSK
jgi:hypothetical protein